MYNTYYVCNLLILYLYKRRFAINLVFCFSCLEARTKSVFFIISLWIPEKTAKPLRSQFNNIMCMFIPFGKLPNVVL